MSRVAILVLAVMFAGVENQTLGVVVHTSDFIPDLYRTNFNGLEGIAGTEDVSPSYSEDGIQVEQINGDGSDIWAEYPLHLPGYEGSRAWYPGGGDNGFTRITRTDGSDFTNVGFLRGSGAHPPTFEVILLYEVYNDGALVLSGSLPHFVSEQVTYLGFSGGGFDEILVRDGMTKTTPIYHLVTSFHDGTQNTLAIDSIELANIVPEPSSLLLALAAAVGLLLVAIRWRQPSPATSVL